MAQDEPDKDATNPPTGLAKEFFRFLRDNRKWWLIPLVTIVLILGALIVFGGNSSSPFVYTLF